MPSDVARPAGGTTTRRHLLQQLSALLLGASLVPDVAAASPAKDTPFGLELIPANFPGGTIQDIVNALALCATVGGHVSKVLHWDDTPGLAALETWGPLAARFGLGSLWQLGPTAVGTPSPPAGYAPTFTDAATRQRYLADVERLAALRPDRLVLITEANLMYRFKPAEFQAFRPLYAEAYARAKAISPNTLVGASWQHTIWFVQMTQDRVDTPALLQPQDFLGFTSYPDSLVLDQAFASIEAIPATWFGAIRDRYPQADIAITETAWSSNGTNGLERQAAYVRELPRMLSTLNASLVTWALQQDIDFFRPGLLSPEQAALLAALGVDVAALFTRFNSMGLIDSQNRAKPAWNEAMALVFPKPVVPATSTLRR